LKALFGLRCPDPIRSIIERFRRETPVISQAEIHARVRLKTVGSV
jgi:flagellar biosynthesis protein FlhA